MCTGVREKSPQLFPSVGFTVLAQLFEGFGRPGRCGPPCKSKPKRTHGPRPGSVIRPSGHDATVYPVNGRPSSGPAQSDDVDGMVVLLQVSFSDRGNTDKIVRVLLL